MIAHINIEDNDDGTISFRGFFPGKFNPDSQAHQAALQLCERMETLGQRIEGHKPDAATLAERVANEPIILRPNAPGSISTN